MSSPPANRLFIISRDPELAEERRALLERTGYGVVSAGNFKEVRELCMRGDFSLAIIGYSIPSREKRRIWAELVTSCPHAPVLELFRGSAPDLPDAQFYLNAQLGVEAIPRKVQEILKSGDGNVPGSPAGAVF
jgi:hypothetical protein